MKTPPRKSCLLERLIEAAFGGFDSFLETNPATTLVLAIVAIVCVLLFLKR